MSENTPKKETETTTKHVTSLPSAHHPQTLGAAAATSFSQLLAGAMESPTASPRGGEVPSFLGQFAMTHQAVLATVTAQAQMDLQTPEALTTDSFQQPVLTPISPSSLHRTPEGNSSIPQAEEPPLTSDPKGQSAQTVGRPNPTDGYNWRKYGQKQVKSSDRSRSYYKCTDANCSAKKKVENGPDGKDTEITYSGQHNHGRPKKKHLKGRGTQPGGSTRPSRENEPLGLPVGGGGEVNDSTTSKTKHVSGIKSPEPPVYCSSDGEGEAEEEHDDEPDPKRRLSESIIPYSEPVMRMAKEPKIVVQSSCDMSRIDDGYRWRKYGQKIVKGNPNPRSYYRCTHNGCPVRKHVERASDDYKAILITYEGKHNHDQPPQQKDGDQSNTAVLIAAAVASVNNDEGVYQSNSFDRNNDAGRDGSKSKELRGALKPAQTLLSIGLNSSTGERASGTNSDGNNHGPLFNKNRSTIPVQNS